MLSSFNRIAVFIAGLIAGSLPLPAQSLDQIGVTALRAVTTNLNGAGIRVAHPEPSLSTNSPVFEVNPASVGQAVSLFTYASNLGFTNDYPNLVGANSGHADAVASFFYGIPNGVATNVAHVDNYDADFFINHYVVSNLAVLDAKLVNQSFTFGVLAVTNQQAVDAIYDDYAAEHGTLFVSPANNGGQVCAPGTSYNCICVGAYGGGSGIGPTLDNNRCKPDIVAPAGLTSIATPQVSGAAAVLMQAALRGDGGADTNAAADLRTIKAVLLNGAVKPVNWTNSNVFPLDARYGAGVLNVLNSYQQLAGEKQASCATDQAELNGAHPPSPTTNTVPVNQAWDLAVIASSATNDVVAHYLFDVTSVTATATLVWSRPAGQTNYSQPINDLDLYLYRCADSNLIARSDSYVNNVEHLYVTNLAAGRYDLQVVKYGGTNVVSDDETYAVAWQFVPPPELAAVRTGTNATLSWPLYPAGFGVETRTNLLAGTWNTNGLPATIITNGQNSIRLNTTNAARFFRLRQPNF